LVAGSQETTAVPVPPMVADAGPSMAVVERFVKWFVTSVVVLWQARHGNPSPTTCSWCSPELKLLNCDVPRAWQFVHWVFTLSVPVLQLGVACPPWQLTFEQFSAAPLSKDDAADCASYVARNATSPGGTRCASLPGRAFARL